LITDKIISDLLRIILFKKNRKEKKFYGFRLLTSLRFVSMYFFPFLYFQSICDFERNKEMVR